LTLGLLICLNVWGGQLETSSPFPVTSFRLENGLEVILSEDDTLPIATLAVAYRAGSLHERPGKSGLAYLLENLMFEGSRNVGRMQHISFIQRIGGRLTALRERDKTIFYQTIPSHHLATALWLESDRMMALTLSSEDIARAKSALIGEIKNRRLRNPFMEGQRYFDALLFPDLAYGLPERGLEEDLKAISERDVREFYETYYRPNNAVLCIVGNIKQTQARELVQKYFGSVPPGKSLPPAAGSSQETDRDFGVSGVTDSLESPLSTSPAFFLGFRIPGPRSNDFYPLRIIEYILMKGNSSRLINRLLKKESLATRLSGGIDVRGDQAAFRIFVVSSNELKAERCQNEILSEINKLKTTRIADQELQKAKNLLRMDSVSRYATSVEKAKFLIRSHLAGIAWEDLSAEQERYLVVTPTRILLTMNKYFNEDRILIHVKTR